MRTNETRGSENMKRTAKQPQENRTNPPCGSLARRANGLPFRARRLKTLWRLAGAADSVAALERRIGEVSTRLDAMAALLADMLEQQASFRSLAETARREAAGDVRTIRKEAAELREAMEGLEAAAASKSRELAEQSEAWTAKIRGEIEAYRAEAGKLGPEIRRLADAVQELNG